GVTRPFSTADLNTMTIDPRLHRIVAAQPYLLKGGRTSALPRFAGASHPRIDTSPRPSPQNGVFPHIPHPACAHPLPRPWAGDSVRGGGGASPDWDFDLRGAQVLTLASP